MPADAPAGRPAAARLEDFGDVLTDKDLAALLQVSPRWAEKQRADARRAGVAPNLPAALPQFARFPRYRKCDVEAWLRTGRSARAERPHPSLRRIS